MSQVGNDQFWGVVSILLGLVFVMHISNCSKSSDDFILIKGMIDTSCQTQKRPKKRTSYRFKLRNYPYRKLTFSNYDLYDMESGVNYKEQFRVGNEIKAHVLRKELWNTTPIKIHSLEVNDKQVVAFEKRRYPDVKNMIIGLIFIGLGFFIAFK